MKNKKCFWCREKEVKDFYVNHRQFCSKECAEKCVVNFKKNLKESTVLLQGEKE